MKELQKVFQNLHGVARRALADLIAAAPERESVFLREILAHAADPDEVLPACIERGGVAPALVVLDQTAAGKARMASLASATVIFSFVRTVTAMECERITGTRTQVQVTRSPGRCRILRPSFCIFISSSV